MNKVVTSRGTVIGRHIPTGVGKRVGGRLYLHRRYVPDVLAAIPSLKELVGRAMMWPAKWMVTWEYACVRIDLSNGEVRFDEAPDFDTAREPHVGRWLKVPAGKHDAIKPGKSSAIWHHKWLWVKDDYRGFDVAESRRWSATYAPLLDRPPSGSARTFASQLRAVGFGLTLWSHSGMLLS